MSQVIDRKIMNALVKENQDTDYCIGRILFTRNGRKIGNAIITGETEEHWIIETDYGNQVTLGLGELETLFHLVTPEDIETFEIRLRSHKYFGFLYNKIKNKLK